jgi:hypothetical protein
MQDDEPAGIIMPVLEALNSAVPEYTAPVAAADALRKLGEGGC